MPARLEGYTTTTAVVGGNRTMRVREWHCYSEPSQTYFELRARVTTTRDQVQGIADGISQTIEQLLAAPDITDIAWSQDVTPSGQLQSMYTVYWAVPGEDQSGFVEIPASGFNVDNVGAQVFADMASGGLITSL